MCSLMQVCWVETAQFSACGTRAYQRETGEIKSAGFK